MHNSWHVSMLDDASGATLANAILDLHKAAYTMRRMEKYSLVQIKFKIYLLYTVFTVFTLCYRIRILVHTPS